MEAEGVGIPDLGGKVLALTHDRRFNFPGTLALTNKFLVTRDTVGVVDAYGPLHVYDRRTGNELDRFHFRYGLGVRGLASDGERVYLHLSGDFDLRREDVLVARIPEEDGSGPGDGEDYSHGFCEFVGKPIGDLEPNDRMRGRAKDNNIEGAIVSYPLERRLSYPRIIFDPLEFTRGNSRYLIHHDMCMDHISSGNGEISVWVKTTNHGEAGCEVQSFIRGDTISHSTHIGSKDPLEDLCIGLAGSRRVLEASYGNPGGDGEPVFHDIPVVFLTRKPDDSPGEILGVQRSGNELHVLHGPDRFGPGSSSGASFVSVQGFVDTYRFAFGTLS